MIKYFVSLIIISLLIIYYLNLDSNLPPITLYHDNISTKIKPNEIDNELIISTENRIYETISSTSPKNNMPQKSDNSRFKQEQPLILINPTTATDDIFKNIALDSKDSRSVKFKKDKNTKNIAEASESLSFSKSNNLKPLPKIKTSNVVDNYHIQLACVKTEEVGLMAWNQIKQNCPKIMQNAKMSIKKIQKTENKFYFLLLAGPYNSLNQAHTICKRLIAKGQYCIINP